MYSEMLIFFHITKECMEFKYLIQKYFSKFYVISLIIIVSYLCMLCQVFNCHVTFFYFLEALIQYMAFYVTFVYY